MEMVWSGILFFLTPENILINLIVISVFSVILLALGAMYRLYQKLMNILSEDEKN